MVDKPPFYNRGVFNKLIVGVYSLDPIRSCFFFENDISAPNRINSRFVFDIILQKSGCQFVILISELNISSYSQSVIFLFGNPRPHRNPVCCVSLELFLDSVLNSVSCSEKNYQNKNTRSHRNSCQKRTELVFGQTFKYFVPSL